MLQLQRVFIRSSVTGRCFNILLISGVGDGRERVLHVEEDDMYSINIRSQFSNNTGLTRRQVIVEGKSLHIVSFYFHLILTFPSFFPSFPMSDSYRDVIVWTVDAARIVKPVCFDSQSGIAEILYNQRYYHYTRKCLHMVRLDEMLRSSCYQV